MNVHDEISDSEVLRAASESLSGMSVANPPDVEAIMARGRARRGRRLASAAGVLSLAAAAAVLALGMTGVAGSARSTGTIRTISFTLVSNANGTDTLTINLMVLLDAAALQRDLQQYGISAMVTSGTFCSSDPAPGRSWQVWSSGGTVRSPTITFNPAAMPAGTELSFGIFRLSSGIQQDEFALIDTDSHTCTSTPPRVPPPHGALLEIGHSS